MFARLSRSQILLKAAFVGALACAGLLAGAANAVGFKIISPNAGYLEQTAAFATPNAPPNATGPAIILVHDVSVEAAIDAAAAWASENAAPKLWIFDLEAESQSRLPINVGLFSKVDEDFWLVQRQKHSQNSLNQKGLVAKQIRRALTGVPDLGPLGNGDGVTSNIETIDYLQRSLVLSFGPPTIYNFGRFDQEVALTTLTLDLLPSDEDTHIAEQKRSTSLLARQGDQTTIQAIETYFSNCLLCPQTDELALHQHKLISQLAWAKAEQMRFDALIAKADVKGITNLLAVCQVCNFSDQAKAYIATQNSGDQTKLEAQQFEQAQTWAEFRAYLAACKICTFNDQAKTEIEALQRQADEQKLIEQARLSPNPEGLLTYINTCALCLFEQEAVAKLKALKNSKTALGERAIWIEASFAQDVVGINDYLSTCTLCFYNAEAEIQKSELELARAIRLFATPCIRLAAPAQYGGVQLAQLNAAKAVPLCQKASELLPARADLKAYLGRALLRSGAYEPAIETLKQAEQTPSAIGLLAYIAYFGLPDRKPDLEQALAWATQAKEASDNTGLLVWSFLARQDLASATDQERADVLLQLGSQQSPWGQYALALHLLEQTQEVPNAGKEAIQWLKRAYEAGVPDAKARYAALIENGEHGLKQDFDRAAQLYLEAYAEGSLAARQAIVAQGADRSQALMKAIQGQLAKDGLYGDEVDGVFGLQTQRSLERRLKQVFL